MSSQYDYDQAMMLRAQAIDVVRAKAPTLPLAAKPLTPRPELLEREWLRGSLSRDVAYRLIVAGDFGAKEIGKLIKLLKAQRAVLSDDDGEKRH